VRVRCQRLARRAKLLHCQDPQGGLRRLQSVRPRRSAHRHGRRARTNRSAARGHVGAKHRVGRLQIIGRHSRDRETAATRKHDDSTTRRWREWSPGITLDPRSHHTDNVSSEGSGMPRPLDHRARAGRHGRRRESRAKRNTNRPEEHACLCFVSPRSATARSAARPLEPQLDFVVPSCRRVVVLGRQARPPVTAARENTRSRPLR